MKAIGAAAIATPIEKEEDKESQKVRLIWRTASKNKMLPVRRGVKKFFSAEKFLPENRLFRPVFHGIFHLKWKIPHQIFFSLDKLTREDTIIQAVKEAESKAILAGADPETVKVVEKEEILLAIY